MSTKAERQAAAKKAARKEKATRAARVVGIHPGKDPHIRVGKLTVVSGLASSLFLDSFNYFGGTSPFDYIIPRPHVKASIEAMEPWNRLTQMLRGVAINLTGIDAQNEPAVHGPGATVSGQIVVGGSVVHIIGEMKAVKKLVKGLPIRP